MRDCPSCGYPFKSVKVAEYNATSLVNAGIQGPKLSLCACELCGMHYVDGGQVNQAWFDNYYLKFYKTDDKPFSDARLNALADCIANSKVDGQFIWNSLDIGGMDRELAKILDEKHNVMCTASGVGGYPNFRYPCVILSHTLEHIYDVPAMMERVKMALIPGGLLFIEVPIWLDYSNLEYDNHWQHINKFRPKDLEDILNDNGFEFIVSERIADYREYNVWRIVGRMP